MFDVSSIDPDKMYRVKLAKSFQIGQTLLTRRNPVRLRGQHIIDNAENIVEAVEVTAPEGQQ